MNIDIISLINFLKLFVQNAINHNRYMMQMKLKANGIMYVIIVVLD